MDWSEDFNRETLCRTSDICFCTSDKLLKAMRKYNQYTYNIGHGYAPSEYELNPEEKKEVGNKFQIKAGYIGNMNSKYLDWETFYLLASKNPEIGFFFIGPKGMSNLSGIEFNEPLLTKLEKLDNTFFLGEKPAYKIPSYLKEFDILLLIYKAKKYKEQVANPHKLLEYFGSGKIVLASWTEEYRDKNDLIEMVPSNDDLPTTFTKVMNNIKFHNQNDKQLKRKKFAMDNSYEKKIHVIENLINEFIL
ncbi:MAG: hypothetical protein KFF73_01600 [Cyclobacteriaceae bacterium]|nr:hypothetical protein [Cyclobacteriaceae bacterium]